MINIVESTYDHAWELCNTLREKDKNEIRAWGITPNKAVLDSLSRSILTRTALVDNEVAAMWGVCGSFIGVTGMPYLLTGYPIEKLSPIKFARLYKNEVKLMMNHFSVLENYVDSEYDEAIKMLQIAGFDILEPIKVNTSKFYKFRMVA